jgi:hypothetical protein
MDNSYFIIDIPDFLSSEPLSSLYVDDVRASQETHLWASTACYGHSFTFYM